MIATTREKYENAISDIYHCTGIKHEFNDTFIEDVLVNGEWKMVGFQKVDDSCFILIGIRNWATRWTARSLNEAIRNEKWYEVTKEEGNAIFKAILKSKKRSKKGKIYYKWDF